MNELIPELKWLCRILEEQDWIFAKTMPTMPHWYTLRKAWERETDFIKAVQLIRQHGIVKHFKGRPYTYFQANGHEYWTMGAPIEKTILINRAVIDEDIS